MHEVAWLDKLIVILSYVGASRCGFEYCHEEPDEPAEGFAGALQFTWLGALQYIHIERGTPEYFRVPRVVLVSRQYALCTARDAALVPPGYALGNVIFDQYECDESECDLTLTAVEEGKDCPSGVLSVPIADVYVHPEYDQYQVNDTLALLKLLTSVRSHYLLPICLPFNNNILTKTGTILKWLYHIDYSSVTPRDMMTEERDFYKIDVLPTNTFYGNEYNPLEKPIIWSSGCDFQSGAPSVLHERTGHWTIVALAVGGSPCLDPLAYLPRPVPPARHILVHPYMEWITKTVTGVEQVPFAKDDPFGFDLSQIQDTEPKQPAYKQAEPKQPAYAQARPAWLGHWWLSSSACYNRGEAAEDMDNFYSEKLRVSPEDTLPKNYFIEIFAPDASTITCVKVGLPYQLASPQAWGIGTTTVKLNIPVVNMHTPYKIHIQAWSISDSPSPKPKHQDIDKKEST